MNRQWWKEAVIYQIYPRSFYDSSGDGIGDLPGILSKLDHIRDLGVDVIWISPFYPSPNDDNGYDISDYCGIHPEFGTMSDFDALLKGIHDRGMKLIVDVVLNHSSDEHEWFMESRKSKDNPHRDYYFWKDPGPDGGPPNNWTSFFGGSAWELDETTGQYYLHLFTRKQPDLNWENPEVRSKVKEVLKFWLDKGVDGFRLDVIPLISKRLDFENTELDKFTDIVTQVYSNGPRVHEYLQEVYKDVFSHYDMMTVGEGPGISTEVGLDYVGADRKELNMIFHLDHMFLGQGAGGKFDPVPYGWTELKELIVEWDAAMGESGWISIFLDNHDFPRMVSRFGNDDEHRVVSAKMLVMMILTLRGTPCLYQGSEIGMTNVHFDSLTDYKDVETHNFHREFSAIGVSDEDFLAMVHEVGRDNVRTPIHWSAAEHGGFTNGDPWIKVNPNYKDINVDQDKASKGSIYAFYQMILSYRKTHPVYVYGDFKMLNGVSEDLFIYERRLDGIRKLIVVNHSDAHQAFDGAAIENLEMEIQNVTNKMTQVLLPWEARIYTESITQ